MNPRLSLWLEEEAHAELHLEGRADLVVIRVVAAVGPLQPHERGTEGVGASRRGAAVGVDAQTIDEIRGANGASDNHVIEVEQVEHLGRKLQASLLAELDVLQHAEIHGLETAVAKGVALERHAHALEGAVAGGAIAVD